MRIYTIEASSSLNHRREEASAYMFEVLADIIDNPARMTDEIIMSKWAHLIIMDVWNAFQDSIVIEGKRIQMNCDADPLSNGRHIQEDIARAIGREIIRQMHKKGMNVVITNG